MLPGVMPVTELYRQEMGTRLNQSQGISWIAYDTESYISATTTELNFFATVKNDFLLSNMAHAGAFPHPDAMHVYAIRVIPRIEPAIQTAAPNALTDAYRLIFNSYCEFRVGHKEFGIWPTWAFPAGAGLVSLPGAAGAEAVNEYLINVTHGLPSPREIYTLIEPVQIDPMINFVFRIRWNAVQTLTATTQLTVAFDGRLIRPVQ